jgi:ubiquitin carboxyl-terminal hydrolase 2
MSYEIETYTNKGLSGLVNLGNTCFLNTCMQLLSHTYELNDFLNDENYKKKLKDKIDSTMLVEWDELRKLLWKDNCVVAPRRFLQVVQQVAKHKDMLLFTQYHQNDMPEFLIFVIDCFHNSLSREVKFTIEGTPSNDIDKLAVLCYEKVKAMYSRDYSEIWNIFYGIQVSQLVSLSTNNVVSMTPEPFFILDLPIPLIKQPTLIDCFELYVEGEVLNGDNQVFNEELKQKEDMQKCIKFWSFPKILVIDIKRFDAYNRKNQNLVTFPLYGLDLSPYVVGYNQESYIYDLYGICNHSGSVLGGHYTAFIKNANNKWYHFNDGSVSEVGMESQLITPKAYCFFYRQRAANS